VTAPGALALPETRPPAAAEELVSILSLVDPVAVSEEARRESRNREVHLPPLSTFRWWARRTAAVNRAVLQASSPALGDGPLDVLDPFAGGGTIPLVALQEGHNVRARDLNPWAAAGIRQMLDLPDPAALAAAYERLGERALDLLEKAYATQMADGEPGQVVHTMRVATGHCSHCDARQRQFPYATLTLLHRRERRRPEAILACPAGHVFEGTITKAQSCPVCRRRTDPEAFYTTRRFVKCAECGHSERLSDRARAGGFEWEIALVERVGKSGREFAVPTAAEIRQAEQGWKPEQSLGEIPYGAETKVLLRHGFKCWEDLYPARQRVVMEKLLELVEETVEEAQVAAALRMAIVGTAEFAGLLSRWDRFYLKCNDATAGHRFNFSTFVPELNVWGAGSVGRGTVTRRVRSMAKAADWLRANTRGGTAAVDCGNSAELPNEADVDLVLTDPPYHDDVHYGELSLLFRGWAGLGMGQLEGEAATNAAVGLNADSDSYADSLAQVFEACHRALRSEGRLVFSYANHEPRAWVALFAALQRAGFHAVACLSVHSENETDFKKRGIRSCTQDLLLELSRAPHETPVQLLSSPGEGAFMDAVADLFAQVGSLGGDWQDRACQSLERARAAELAEDSA
jgi:putative DNA methylase